MSTRRALPHQDGDPSCRRSQACGRLEWGLHRVIFYGDYAEAARRMGRLMASAWSRGVTARNPIYHVIPTCLLALAGMAVGASAQSLDPRPWRRMQVRHIG